MKGIGAIKKEKKDKVNALIASVGMFFAFSNQQFAENKTSLREGEKYLSLGAGAYLPKGNIDLYLNGLKEINKWYKLEVKNNSQRREDIMYELNNHEAYATGEVDDTLAALGEDYTREEVVAVLYGR